MSPHKLQADDVLDELLEQDRLAIVQQLRERQEPETVDLANEWCTRDTRTPAHSEGGWTRGGCHDPLVPVEQRRLRELPRDATLGVSRWAPQSHIGWRSLMQASR